MFRHRHFYVLYSFIKGTTLQNMQRCSYLECLKNIFRTFLTLRKKNLIRYWKSKCYDINYIFLIQKVIPKNFSDIKLTKMYYFTTMHNKRSQRLGSPCRYEWIKALSILYKRFKQCLRSIKHSKMVWRGVLLTYKQCLVCM